MIVLVYGGRGYSNRKQLYAILDDQLRDSAEEVCTGGAPGADTLAVEWAIDRDVFFYVRYADWERLGKAAGPIRNGLLLKEREPDISIGFPGGRGTANMRRRVGRLPNHLALRVG